MNPEEVLAAQRLILIGTLGGAFVGGLFAYLATWISKRSEGRRFYRELVMRTAAEHWIHMNEATIKAGGGSVEPYDIYLVHLLPLARLLDIHKVDSNSVIQALKESDAITQDALKNKQEYYASLKHKS